MQARHHRFKIFGSTIRFAPSNWHNSFPFKVLAISQYFSPGKLDFRNEFKAQSLGNVCLTRAIEATLPPLHVACLHTDNNSVLVFFNHFRSMSISTKCTLFSSTRKKSSHQDRIGNSPKFSSLHAVSAPKNFCISQLPLFSFCVTKRPLSA